MSNDDFNQNPSAANDQFSDPAHQQGQGQTQGGVQGAGTDPLSADNDTGTEGVTGPPPSSVATDDATLEEAQDNLPTDDETAVEEVDSDPTTEPAGAADPAKQAIDLDIEDETETDEDDDADVDVNANTQ